MDKTFLVIFPYWLVFASVIVAQVLIWKFKVIPTLKKHGRDYEEYWSNKKRNKQLEEYVELCKQQDLPGIYWKYMKVANKIAFVLLVGWFFLPYFVPGQTR